MNIKKIKNIYFIGIGGIGMSALVWYFKKKKKNILGYDIKKSKITQKIENNNIKVIYKDNVKLIPKYINKYNTLIIKTSAIKDTSNNLLKFFKKQKIIIKKRSEILGLITKNKYVVAISGTHGKTTTSTILSHILYFCKKNITAFLGGISKNYNSNFIYQGKKIYIIEADEFDKSFLYLKPDIICITSIDLDHTDIYKNKNILKNNYYKFINLLKPKGILITNHKTNILSKITYSSNNKSATCYSENLKYYKNNWIFDYYINKKQYKNIKLPILGNHNLENVIAAITIAIKLNIKMKDIKNALNSFQGIERRLSVEFISKKVIYIDDYAHHPTEIIELFKTIKKFYKKKYILAIFQPHLYSRTKKFIKNFSKALENFNTIILLNIFPAREKNIYNISSKKLLKNINIKNKTLCSNKNNILKYIKNKKFDAIVTMGAGDINEIVKKIKKWLINNND